MGRIILLFIYFFISSFWVNASVVLNEVAIQPNQVVELYNTSSESADISSWYIDDSGGMTYFTIPSQTILAPKSCLIFNSDFNFNKSSIDDIRLFDNTSPPTSSSARLIEHYSYAKAPDANYSFSKKIDGGSEWQTSTSSLGLFNESLLSCIPIPTPTLSPTETPIPTSTITPSPTNQPTQEPSPTSQPDYQHIYISEIYPYPQSNEHEWIELYNDNDTQVHLDHWYIDDGENTGSAPKSFSLTIEPYAYGTADISSSLFNNSGDTVRLLNRDKQEKESMEYGKITQGKSMGRISFSEDLYCEQEPSKNTVNLPCIVEITYPISSQTTTKKAIESPQKIIPPTKKPLNQQQINTINVPKTIPTQQEGQILGIQTTGETTSPTPYLSSISFSYSLLTIVSVFIKMKNA